MSWPFCISAAPAALDRYPRGVTGHVARPSRSIETRSLPTLTRSYPCRFTFYVALPGRSIHRLAERFVCSRN